jgi:ABC-type antimicrobial peptide transport system permease subunit
MAYEHIGLLYAVLGLTICHLVASGGGKKLHHIEALEHVVNAILSLSSLMDDRNVSLQENRENILLATILVLVLHFVSEKFSQVQNLIPIDLSRHRYLMTLSSHGIM